MGLRTVTRPDIKWLLNEAAALTGQLAQLDQQAAEIATRRLAIERTHAACLRTLGILSTPLPGGRALALPTVKAHRPYGGWGALRAFLRKTLETAAPSNLDTMELALLAVEHFALEFANADEFYRFKNNSLGNALRYLKNTGLVDHAGARETASANFAIWRWKNQLPDIRELEVSSGTAPAILARRA